MIKISKEIIDLEKVDFDDVLKVCHEIAGHDKKSCRNGIIKGRYWKPIDKYRKLSYEAKQKGDVQALSEIIEGFEKKMRRYLKLNPNLTITPVIRDKKNCIKIEEVFGDGKISSLRTMYRRSKQNEVEHLTEKNQRQKEEEKTRRTYEELEEKRNSPEAIAAREESRRNERAANEMMRRIKAAPYEATIVAREAEIMEKYGKTPGGVAWDKMQEATRDVKKTMEEQGLRGE